MKKVAGLMLIVLSLIQLIGNLISIPDQLEYMSGFQLIYPLMVWPLTNVAFMLLGLSLFVEKIPPMLLAKYQPLIKLR